MIDVETIVLEDGNEYIIANKTMINYVEYYILVNVRNEKDFIIRKKNGNNLIGLKDEEEYNAVMNHLYENEIK